MKKRNKKDIEVRSFTGELRASDEEGIIEGYIVVWDTIDSYKSTFKRGSFKKTLSERFNKIKMLWNHQQEVIGIPLELREDDHGVFFRGKLILAVEKANETYELAKAGAIDTFSFGFRTIKDTWINGVRNITEVMLFEVSPVIFEANEHAQITGVRDMTQQTDEQRDTDFNITDGLRELRQRGYRLLRSLEYTLDDIWWTIEDEDEIKMKVGEALSAFSSAYSDWTDEVFSFNSDTGQRSIPVGNELGTAFNDHLVEKEMTPEQFAATTSFTLDETLALRSGKIVAAVEKLDILPEEIQKLHQVEKGKAVESLCTELRSSLTQADRERVKGILFETRQKTITVKAPVVDQVAMISDFMTDFRKKLETNKE